MLQKVPIVKNVWVVTVDSKFSFDDDIKNLCCKASQKLHALSSVAGYMSFDKRTYFLKTIIVSQFNYCPLVWIIHGRGLNNKINNLHERALRVVYQNKNSDFYTLLKVASLLQFTGETYIIS